MTESNLQRSPKALLSGVVLASLLLGALPAGAKVVDDFNGVKTGWQDANPANLPFPGGTIVNQQFVFNLPTVGQSYFVNSTKTTEKFELKEGRTIEFRVDMVSGLGANSFAVLAWIPEANGANSLAGYGIAKSETDMLVTKGINKYFYNETPTPAIKNDNVTLVLSVKAKGGNVILTGKVLDKDSNDAVIFEKTFVDTPSADVMADGADDPSAPFLGNGYFTLYLYANTGTDDAYQVVLDNAEAFVTDDAVLDDFNGTKTGWQDANPANLPFPGGTIVNQQFVFNLPAIGQPYFVNSTKTTKTFELAEGTRHEFRVDMVSGQGGDSFTVLAWIPEANGANSLAGYGIAKSETDMLITKGINKYFYNENPTPALKNENIMLVLNLTVRKGNVIVNARVLDKDDGNKVIFEKTFVDTPAADVMADGQDDPPTPFLAKGQVVLYLYADGGQDPAGYQVIVDNLEVSAPPAAANIAPIITEVSPLNGANFLPASTQISFTANDDNALPDAGISVDLNGTVYTTANGLTLSGPTTARKATLGGLTSGQNYVAILNVVDAGGATSTQTLMFDTFPSSLMMIEVEDYNFEAGSYFSNPVLTPTGGGESANSYTDRMGTEGTDFHDTRTGPNGGDTAYRTYDPVRMQASLDLVREKYTAAGGKDNGYIDYDVGDLAADEWLNYTRSFTSGTYQIYLRESVVNFAQADSRLEMVTGDRTQPEQTTTALGTFSGKLSGYSYRNVPLTDAAGKPVIVRLSGVKTLRLHHVTADTSSSARYLNYLILQPVADPGLQRATVASLTPAADATVETAQPVIQAEIQNRDTTVNVSTVKLTLNGQAVAATVTPTATGATLSYAFAPLPVSGSLNAAKITFKDDTDTEITAEWSFTITYKSLDPANRRSGPGLDRGFTVRMVQAPSGSNLENSLDRAETQLATGSTIPVYVDTNVVLQIVNMNEVDGGAAGHFPDDTLVPGLDDINGTDDYTVEIRGWLELTAGVHRLGVTTDDGYKVSSGAKLSDKEPVLAFQNGGPGDGTFDFVVPTAGFYPFRLIWYERGGASHGEWFSQDMTTGERTLLNDPAVASAIKVYRDVVAAPTVQVLSAAVVTGPYTAEAGAQVADGKVTLPLPGANRFYRLSISQGAVNITGIAIEGQNLVIRYTAQ